MSLRRVPPKEAQALITDEGYACVDVRSIPEYEQGHVPGAYSLPFMHRGPAGMSPNPEFSTVLARLFPDKQAKLVFACKSGPRSTRAGEQMIAAGYTNIVEMRGGWSGDGNEPGWDQVGLPVERETPGKSWNDLKK